MSTNDNPPAADDLSRTRAVEVHRSALLEPQEGGWAGVPELAEPPRPYASNLSSYMHGLRRHWAAATSLGALLAALLGVAVWFGWGARYAPTAYLRVEPTNPVVAFQTVETQNQRVTEFAYDIYKDTQHQLLKNPFVLNAALRKPEVARLHCVQREQDPIVWLQEELRVRFPGKAEIMEVSLAGRDKKEMTHLVNAVVDAYLKEVVDSERTQRVQRLSELDGVYTEKEEDMRAKLTDLTNLAETLGTSEKEALSLRQQIVMHEYSDYRREYARVQFGLRQAQGELQAQQARLEGVDELEIPSFELETYSRTNPVLRQLFDELAWRRLERAQDEATVRQGSQSPFVQRRIDDMQLVQAQIEELEDELREGVRAMKRAEINEIKQEKEIEVAVLTEQERILKDEVGKKKEEAEQLSKSSIDLEMMRSEIEHLDTVLRGIAEERERLRVELRSASRVRLWQRAEEPKRTVNLVPRIALTIMAMLVGLCVPVGGIAWWDTRAQRINSSTDVSRGLGLTVLGSVPMIPARVMRQLGAPSQRHQSWHMRLTESIDGIAARLLRQAELQQARVVLVSSAATGEGKTSLATQLAMSFARSGRRSVLVDFDLRRPAFDGVFGLALAPGVSEALRGENELSEVVQPTGAENLSVVTAGRWDRHALTALANGAAGSMFDRLRGEFEFVVVDTSPILPVADTRYLSQHADTVILSVFRDVSQAPKIVEACEILEAFGVRTVEAVVTGPSEYLPDRDLGYVSSLPA